MNQKQTVTNFSHFQKVCKDEGISERDLWNFTIEKFLSRDHLIQLDVNNFSILSNDSKKFIAKLDHVFAVHIKPNFDLSSVQNLYGENGSIICSEPIDVSGFIFLDFELSTKDVKHTLSFSENAFLGKTSFDGYNFKYGSAFNKCKFFGEVNFGHLNKQNIKDTIFLNTVYYLDIKELFISSVVFTESVYFEDVIISSSQSCEYYKHVDFNETILKEDEPFYDTIFRSGASFAGEYFYQNKFVFWDSINTDSEWDLFNWPKLGISPIENKKLIRLYEKLKLKADKEKRLHDEQIFLRMELGCRERTERSFLAKFGSILFRRLSDYGWSVSLPLRWICLSFGVGAILFYFAGLYPGVAIALSASNQVGFFGFNRMLFEPEPIMALPGWAKLLIAVQSVTGAVFLFLLLLALRNRFRMR